MNANLQKWAPPAAVLGIALYLSWPPSEPLDLGENVVRAKAVRWKAKDLDSPSVPPQPNRDPFGLLVATNPVVQDKQQTETDEAGEQSDRGPSVDEIRSGITLGGIARTNRHRWAILNGQVCRIGDPVAVTGFDDLKAVVTSIETGIVMVKAHDRTIEIRPQSRDLSAPTRHTRTEKSKDSDHHPQVVHQNELVGEEDDENAIGETL